MPADSAQAGGLATESIAAAERYDLIKAHLLHHDAKISQAFELWTTLMAGTVGGVLALRLQHDSERIWPLIRTGAIAVFVLVTVASLLLIWLNLVAWRGFRVAEAGLNPNVGKPSWKSCYGEITMTVVEVVAAGAAWAFMRIL